MGEINFNFKNYNPIWQEYGSMESILSTLFMTVVNECVIDIKGVVSQNGWEPDWPIVIQFESSSISFNTKCGYLWAIGSFENIEFCYEENDLPLKLRYEPLSQYLDITSLLNNKLIGVYMFENCVDKEQVFLLQIGRYYLKIFDAGDELGLEIVTSLDVSIWKKIV